MDIRERRERLGMTQNDLAIKSGVKQSVLSDIENYKTTRPRIDTIFRIARALGCAIEDLIAESDDNTSNDVA